MSNRSDKATIGLTDEGARVLAKIEDLNLFENGRDIGKFAIAVAAKRGTEPREIEGTGTTWHSTNFDKTGDIRQFIEAHYSDVEHPYRVAEGLIDEGLRILDDEMEAAGDLILTDFIE